MYRQSNYNFIVPFQNNVILYNGLSNILFVFLQDEYKDIQLLLNDLDNFESDHKEIFQSFVEGGFIIDENFDELDYIKLQNKKKIFANTDYHITINPTLDCNLSCWYCSVKHEKANYKDTIMSSATLGKIYSFFDKEINNGTRKFHLAWFGGEPTEYFDEIIRPLGLFLNEKKGNRVSVAHTITTNASLITKDMINEMGNLGFSGFQIPIDGNSKRHNLIKHQNRKPTYDIVMENINNISKMIPDAFITVRINYDRQTLRDIEDILRDLPPSSPNISVDFQRVWQIPVKDNEYNLLKETKQLFHDKGYRNGYWAFSPLKFHRCYADKYNYFVINYDGNIFKCSARDYSKESRVGYLDNDGKIIWNDSALTKMYSHSTFENKMCIECKLLPLCFGPCIQKNYESDISNTPLQCLYASSELSIDSFIIDVAKERGLL